MDETELPAFEAKLEREGLENVRLRADRAGIFAHDLATRAWIAKKDREAEAKKHRDTRAIAIGALVVSVIAVLVAILTS